MPNQRHYGPRQPSSPRPTLRERAHALGVSVATLRRWDRVKQEVERARRAGSDLWHANGGEDPFAAWEPPKGEGR